MTPRRLQGFNSSLSDLKLRSGKGLAVEMSGALTPTAEHTRTIQGASSIKLNAYDPDLTILRAPLLSERFEAHVDGLRYRYLGIRKSGLNLSITLEDRWVSVLRERKGPLKVYARRGKPDEVTRAEFICISLVKEAAPGLEIVCPQLHDRQPIETSDQGDKAKDDALDRRDRGIGSTRGLTVKGQKATPAQIDAGDRAIRAGASRSAPREVLVALVEALAVESEFGELSGNWLQIEPESVSGFSGNPNNLEEAVTGFLLGYESGSEGAIEHFRKHPSAKPHEIAQAVQRSGAGQSSSGAGNYGVWQEEAEEWVDAYDGAGAGSGSTEVTKARAWQVGEKEGYWEAIQRLAKEVNWRAFIVGNRFYFIDEYELARGTPRMVIDADADPGDPDFIPPANVDFDYNRNKPVTEITVKMPVGKLKAPPGSVVLVEGYGPASVGFGDAPAKKGQKIGLSGNRKAATGEGRGRYIVVSITAPLREVAGGSEATVKLRKPTAPLPEPARETESSSRSRGSGEGPEKAQELHDWLERQVGKPYRWGAVGPDGYDCSGLVSAGLMEVGLLQQRLTTSGFTSYGEAGEGEYITIYDKAGTGDPHTEHVVIEVLGDVFECGGISGGVGKPNYSASDLAGFTTKRHPKGF
jgi:hypothetical protein